LEADMLRSFVLSLSLAIITVLGGVQAASAQTSHSRPAKSVHGRTAAPPNRTAVPHGPTQDEKKWMDRASSQGSGDGGGGGGM
jgi:hypothetical protein